MNIHQRVIWGRRESVILLILFTYFDFYPTFSRTETPLKMALKSCRPLKLSVILYKLWPNVDVLLTISISGLQKKKKGKKGGKKRKSKKDKDLTPDRYL